MGLFKNPSPPLKKHRKKKNRFNPPRLSSFNPYAIVCKMKKDAVVAYLVGEYRKTTHTFIHREVRELRRQGVKLHTFTIRDRCDFPDPLYLSDEPPTRQVLTYNPIKILAAQFFWIQRSPAAYLQAMKAAWTLRAPGAKSLLYAGFYFLEATVFARSALELGVSHFHNHFGDSSGNVVFIASRLAKIPFSITFHGPDIFNEAKKWHLGLKQKFAKFTVGTSSYAKSQVMLFSDELEQDNMHVIRAAIDLADFINEPPHVPTTKWKLLFIARTAPAKGWRVLLEAAEKLERAGVVDFSLSIVAAGPPHHLKKLKESIARRGLSSVHVSGACPPATITALIGSHDILLSTSFAEGLPVVLIEAMAMGKAVVATAVGGVGDLVRHDENGILVPPARPDLVAQAITELTQDPERYTRICKAARLEIQLGYQAESEFGRLKALFNDH